MKHPNLNAAIQAEIDLYLVARRNRIQSKCSHHLGRAHILAQKRIIPHITVHLMMLFHALSRRDVKEIGGQLVRLLATVPGHLFNKLPKGNTGWANVSMFREMEIPSDLKKILERN